MKRSKKSDKGLVILPSMLIISCFIIRFNTIIQIIIDKVKTYQASADDIELEEFRHTCISNIHSNEFYKNFIPMFFIEVFKRLDKISCEREQFIKMMINK